MKTRDILMIISVSILAFLIFGTIALDIYCQKYIAIPPPYRMSTAKQCKIWTDTIPYQNWLLIPLILSGAYIVYYLYTMDNETEKPD